MQQDHTGRRPRRAVRGTAALTLVLAATLMSGACRGDRERRVDDGEYRPVVQFGTAQGRIITATDTIRLALEIAEREDQRAYGLMERPSLDENAGMIFLFDSEQPAEAGFWMYRTRIPLDIAYLSADGTIVSIRAMYPCPSPDPRGCPVYPAGVPYHQTLEVNHGWFAAHGVGVGDQVLIDR